MAAAATSGPSGCAHSDVVGLPDARGRGLPLADEPGGDKTGDGLGREAARYPDLGGDLGAGHAGVAVTARMIAACQTSGVLPSSHHLLYAGSTMINSRE